MSPGLNVKLKIYEIEIQYHERHHYEKSLLIVKIRRNSCSNVIFTCMYSNFQNARDRIVNFHLKSLPFVKLMFSNATNVV